MTCDHAAGILLSKPCCESAFAAWKLQGEIAHHNRLKTPEDRALHLVHLRIWDAGLVAGVLAASKREVVAA